MVDGAITSAAAQKRSNFSVAGNAQNYARAKRRSSVSPAMGSPPSQLRRAQTGPSPGEGPGPPLSRKMMALRNAVVEDLAQDVSSVSIAPGDGEDRPFSPASYSGASEANSVDTLFDEPQALANSHGRGSICSNSSIATVITVASAPDSPPASEILSTCSLATKEWIHQGSYSMEDVRSDDAGQGDALVLRLWEARRHASRLPYWDLVSLEQDEEAKRGILLEAETEIRSEAANWYCRLGRFAQAAHRMHGTTQSKQYSPSYLTPYQLQRLEMTTRQDLQADEQQQRDNFRNDFRTARSSIIAAEKRLEQEWKDSCLRFSKMEESVRRVISKAQEELAQEMFEHHQNVMLILYELKRVNHAHHVAQYYSSSTI